MNLVKPKIVPTRPLRILSIGHSYVVALNRSILREIAKDKNYEVTIGAPKQFHGSLRSIPCEDEPQGSPLKIEKIEAYWTSKMHLFFYNPMQLAQLMGQGFDVLHLWEEPYILSGFQVARSAHRLKIPFCIRTAQSLNKKYPFPFGVFEKKVFHWASRWVAGGQLVYETMSRKGWNERNQGKILTLAVDTEAFQPFENNMRLKVVQGLGLSGPLIGYLGRLSEEKGLDLLMEALLKIKDEPWSVLFMGSGPYKKNIEDWASKHGLQSRVKVRLLNHEEVPKTLPACDLLVCPSQTRSFWKEQFGRMIVEGFAAGVPVIGSDSGEIPRVIGEAGVVLPEGDVEAWAEEIKLNLQQEGRRLEMSKKGLQRCHEFSAKTLGEKYKNFYKEIANF